MSVAASGISGAGSPQIVSSASGYAAPAVKMSNLYSQIDVSGQGTISQDQFNQAFQTMNPPGVFKAAGAQAIFGQLDPGATGSVSKADFVKVMSGLVRSLRAGAGSNGSAGASPATTLATSLQSLNQLGGSPSGAWGNGVGTNVNLLA